MHMNAEWTKQLPSVIPGEQREIPESYLYSGLYRDKYPTEYNDPRGQLMTFE